MPIQLHDSLSREIRPLQPADGQVFRMYCCGPTVYGPAHIGNFRTFILQDVLRRALEIEGRSAGWAVKHVRNITDIDDKTLSQAVSLGKPLLEVTTCWLDRFRADCAELNLLEPSVEPSAIEEVPEQVAMIDALLGKGLAYVASDGSVYFKVEAFPEYGKLSRLRERELKTGATRRASTVAADEYERDSVADFALWKAWKPEDGPVKFPGPEGAGEGRPGWHIECSAMARKHLGDTIDLHAGGVDLLFPHHENEIAQSEGCTGKTFSRHWFHTTHLLVDDKKMSKSLGNLYTLDDLKAKGYSAMAVRYALLAGHYRTQLNFTLDSLHSAESALGKMRKIVRRFLEACQVEESSFENLYSQASFGLWPIAGEAWDALRDDLNTALSLGFFFKRISEYEIAKHEKPEIHYSALVALSRLMFAYGIRLFEKSAKTELRVPSEIEKLARERWSAKQARDFSRADRLRDEIAQSGWKILDSKDGYKLEPSKKSGTTP